MGDNPAADFLGNLEQYFAINIIFEPLVGELIRSGFFMQAAAANGDFITPPVISAAEADYERNLANTIDLMYLMVNDAEHGAHNRGLFHAWIKKHGDLADKAVLEIGPGPGGLTRALLRAGARVTAVEMDRRCLPALAELEAAFPGKLRVIEGDAMKLDHNGLMGEPYAVVANLPYNVGTALLVRWLGGEQWPPRWTSLTLMFQKEVVDRMAVVISHDGSPPELTVRSYGNEFGNVGNPEPFNDLNASGGFSAEIDITPASAYMAAKVRVMGVSVSGSYLFRAMLASPLA